MAPEATADPGLFTEPVARRHLAALYGLAVHCGWSDLTSTHNSSRIEEEALQPLLARGLSKFEMRSRIEWPSLLRRLDRTRPDYKD